MQLSYPMHAHDRYILIDCSKWSKLEK